MGALTKKKPRCRGYKKSSSYELILFTFGDETGLLDGLPLAGLLPAAALLLATLAALLATLAALLFVTLIRHSFTPLTLETR